MKPRIQMAVNPTWKDNIKRIVPLITEKSEGKLDLVLNCSAILHPSGKGETSLRDVSFEVEFIFNFYK